MFAVETCHIITKIIPNGTVNVCKNDNNRMKLLYPNSNESYNIIFAVPLKLDQQLWKIFLSSFHRGRRNKCMFIKLPITISPDYIVQTVGRQTFEKYQFQTQMVIWLQNKQNKNSFKLTYRFFVQVLPIEEKCWNMYVNSRHKCHGNLIIK